MSDIRPSNLPIEETDLIGFVHTDRGIDGSAKFNLANVSSALNLDGMATQAPSNVAITGGTITGITDLAVADGGTGASTLTGYVQGTGTAALTASATIPNTDITGLGTMSTQDAATVNIDGGTIDGTTIGAGTPSTGAFTTVNTKGFLTVVRTDSNNSAQLDAESGTTHLISINPNSTFLPDVEIQGRNNTPTTQTYGLFTSTGLAVTGALSATGDTTLGSGTTAGQNSTVNLGNGPGVKMLSVYSGGSDSTFKLQTFDGAYNDRIAVAVGGATTINGVGAFSSTGLAVTGALSSTTGANFATSSGSVGIGTASPANLLDVVGGRVVSRGSHLAEESFVEAQAFDYFSATSFTGTSLRQFGSTATGTIAGLSKASLGELVFQNCSNALIATNGATAIVFATNNTERLRITSAGNVGIGTSTPGSKLDVNGNVAVTGTLSDTIGDVRLLPQNSQSTAYTLVLADSGKHLLHPSADTTARTFTIPANGSVAYPIGTAITFVNQDAAGVLTIAITTDTMRLAGAGTTGSRTLAANGIATCLKVTSTEWIISGTGLT